MSVYIVVTESFYGSPTHIKAFRSEINAINYANLTSTVLGLDVISLPFHFITKSDSTSLSIVVTEDCYGGDIKLFSSNSEANNYCNSVTSGPDVIACNIPLI
jgi:hypothetical protein